MTVLLDESGVSRKCTVAKTVAAHLKCDAILLPGGEVWCRCPCHADIKRELEVLGLANISLWPWEIKIDEPLCEDCGVSADIVCAALIDGGMWGSKCDHVLRGASTAELRDSIARHLMTQRHVRLERDADRGFYTTREPVKQSA